MLIIGGGLLTWIVFLAILSAVLHVLFVRVGLRRSMDNRIVGGVCGGLEDWTGCNAWIWRLLFVVPWHGSVGWFWYLLLWFDVPGN